MYFAIGILLLVLKIVLTKISFVIGADVSNMFVSNTSFLVVIMAIMLLVAFSRINITKNAAKKIIKALSAGTFGVYLIHVHPVIFDNLFPDMFKFTLELSPLLMTAYVFGAAIAIFAACWVIEYIRAALFKIVGINKLIGILDKKLGSRISVIDGGGVTKG